jgi:hypothetical protein
LGGADDIEEAALAQLPPGRALSPAGGGSRRHGRPDTHASSGGGASSSSLMVLSPQLLHAPIFCPSPKARAAASRAAAETIFMAKLARSQGGAAGTAVAHDADGARAPGMHGVGKSASTPSLGLPTQVRLPLPLSRPPLLAPRQQAAAAHLASLTHTRVPVPMAVTSPYRAPGPMPLLSAPVLRPARLHREDAASRPGLH